MATHTFLEVHLLITAHQQLLALLDARHDTRLRPLRQPLQASLQGMALQLQAGLDREAGLRMLVQARAALCEFPQALRQLQPQHADGLLAGLEHDLGYRFADFDVREALAVD